jgi:hypothetical protein
MSFPSPSKIKAAQDLKWLERNTRFLFKNLSKQFELQATRSESLQTINLVRAGTHKRGAALWVRNFTKGDCVAQIQHGIDTCNRLLAGTGWCVIEILPTTARSQSQYDINEYWKQSEGSRGAFPRVPALDVVLQYECDEACAAK